MDKTEYMTSLRQELEGLPAEVIEETMWSYESKFIDALLAGRSESEIAASLPQPRLLAAQKRASLRFQNAKKNVNPGNLAHLLVALLGVLVFNLFMILPAMFYSVILFASYLSSLALYFVGIVMLAASLSGVQQMQIDLPVHRTGYVQEANAEHAGSNVRVEISEQGIVVDDDADVESALVREQDLQVDRKPDHKVVHIHIANQLTQVDFWHGLGFLLGGIALFLLCLCMTRYSFIGFKNYLRWNLSLLRLPAAA